MTLSYRVWSWVPPGPSVDDMTMIYKTEITITNNINTASKYSTDEAVMLADAKKYARDDFKQTMAVVIGLGLENTPTEAEVAKALIDYKYKVIKESRENRVSFFD